MAIGGEGFVDFRYFSLGGINRWWSEGFVYEKWLMVTKVLLGRKKWFDTTWRNAKVILDGVLAFVLKTREIITLKERKRWIYDKDKPKRYNLKYY